MDSKFLRVKFINWLFARPNDITGYIRSLYSDINETRTKINNLEVRENQSITLCIKLDSGATLPTQPYPTDACWDLYALDDVWLKPGESTYVPTGVYIDIPVGYEGELKCRSSHGKIGLSIHHGTIDAGYQGEISPFLHNWLPSRYEVHKGERICQFCLRKVINIAWNQVEEFVPSIRGTSGFGSSGK